MFIQDPCKYLNPHIALINIVSEFRISNYMTLRLEDDKTIIYINGKRFRHCKGIFLNIIKEKNTDQNSINSVDDITEIDVPTYNKITPEQEYFGHCSNLQAWYGHEYNMRLIHSNLGFDILATLSKAGEPLAKKKIKEEIARRMRTGSIKTCHYLVVEHFLDYLNEDEISILLLENNNKLRRTIETTSSENTLMLYLLLYLYKDYDDKIAKKVLKDKLREIYIKDNHLIEDLKIHGFYNIFNYDELIDIIFKSSSNITKNLLNLIKKAGISLKAILTTLRKMKNENVEAIKLALCDLLTYGVTYSENDILIIKKELSEEEIYNSFKIKLKYLIKIKN